MKTRSNFYVDSERLRALRKMADTEETSVSDLVREGIDRVIADRMARPKRERSELRTKLEAFLERYADTGPERLLEEIENLVTEAS